MTHYFHWAVLTADFDNYLATYFQYTEMKPANSLPWEMPIVLDVPSHTGQTAAVFCCQIEIRGMLVLVLQK